MAYLAVNKDGTEVRFNGRKKPFKWKGKWWQPAEKGTYIEGREVHLSYSGKTIPANSIIALTGKKISWEDQPIKI